MKWYRADVSTITIRPCAAADLPALFSIVNDAAQAYKGVIPADCWHEPYMPLDQLKQGIRDGIVFWGYEAGGELVGLMGIQDRGEVALSRPETERLLRKYWSISGRQIETSVVLANARWTS